MASCSQYSAAFGYNVYLVPVYACGVDLSSVEGGVKAGGFIDPSNPVSGDTVVMEGATSSEIYAPPNTNIVYDNDTVPTETTVRLYGLTNAALETDTSSETVTTYDTESKGFDQSVAVSKSWSISLEGVSQFQDAGYKILRLLEQNAVAGQLKCKIGRIGPTGTTEAIYGYATLSSFSESIEAGSIVSWSCTAEGYGPYAVDLDNGSGAGPTPDPTGGITSFGAVTAGSGYTEGTYNTVALTGGSGSNATANIVVDSNGNVTGVTMVNGGMGFTAGDELSAADSDLGGGGGSGFMVAVGTIGITRDNFSKESNLVRGKRRR
jgi:hypothetical protein